MTMRARGSAPLAALLIGTAAALAGCSVYQPVHWSTPGKAGPVAATPGPRAAAGGLVASGQHLVLPGDTLSSLARRYGTTNDALARANGLSPPYPIYAGQVLRIPSSAPAPGSGPVHVVARGESLSAIAARHRVSPAEVARLNGLRDADRILVGQRLRLPQAAAGVAVAARPAPSGASPPPPARIATAALPPPPAPPDPARARASREAAEATPAPLSGEGFVWPVEGQVIATFGPKGEGRRNDGINIAARRGAPVRAAEAGIVVYASDELAGYGQMVLIRHAGDYLTTYAHNEALLVAVGDRVGRAQVIARVGNSGGVTEPQLHFAIREGRRPVDPLAHLGPTRSTLASRG
jgi:murein DD-endopeptidase MepM/ murein hydrolase activator NlpD